MLKNKQLTIITAMITASGFIMINANKDIIQEKIEKEGLKSTEQILTNNLINETQIEEIRNSKEIKKEQEIKNSKEIKKEQEIKNSKEIKITKNKKDKEIKEKIHFKAKKYTLRQLKVMTVDGFKVIKKQKQFPTKKSLHELEKVYSLPKGLLYAVMIKESEGNTNAESSKSAKGLFQFTPITAKEFGLIINGKDYRTNEWRSAEAAARYLNWIFTYLHPEKNRFKIDNYKYVLAAYNAGIGNVKSKNGLIIPNFIETINYVKLITQHVKGQIYIVKKGDRFKSIAKEHNLSTIKLSRLNNGVSQETLIAGSYLLIDKIDGLTLYKVKKGDSLYKLAKTYNTSINKIKKVNDLNNNNIGIGQKIKIPN